LLGFSSREDNRQSQGEEEELSISGFLPVGCLKLPPLMEGFCSSRGSYPYRALSFWASPRPFTLVERGGPSLLQCLMYLPISCPRLHK
jgi:hypothetical protein